MPNIKIVNIRFNLDNDERDRKIHEALFQYPDGGRNQVVKEALYLYLIGENAGALTRKPVKVQAMPNQDAGSQGCSGQANMSTTAIESANPETATSNDGDQNNGEEPMIDGLRSMVQ